MTRQHYQCFHSRSAWRRRFLTLALMIFATLPWGVWAAPSALTPEQAAQAALNRVEQRDGELRLHHPHHRVDFVAEGVRFRPVGAEYHWHWQLSHVGAGDDALSGVTLDPVSPILSSRFQVDYPRGALTERYVFREQGVEQQFLIPEALPLDGADLIIGGRVDSAGQLRRHGDGWVWGQGPSQVSLGDVTVLDASGRRLPATMSVVADATRIRVDGTALANAEYPVLVDPVIGGEEIRITDETDFGPDNLYAKYARPAVVYNDQNDQYLVCWTGVVPEGDITNPRLLVNQAVCKLLDGNGQPVSDDVVVSDMNGARARYVVTGYGNTVDGVRYLVAWEGIAEEGEPRQVFYSLLDSSLATLRFNRVLNSALPDASREARFPAITFNESFGGQFTVVYQSDYNPDGSLADDEFEIFAIRVRSGGGVRGLNQVSNMSGFAQAPAVAYGSANDQSLVVWHGVDSVTGTTPQIWGRFLSLSNPQGTQFPISSMALDAYAAALDYDSFNNAFLVAWTGLEDTAIDYEIYAQGVDADDASLRLADDLQISDMGPVGDLGYEGGFPAVGFNPDEAQVLVTWSGDDDDAWVDDPTKILGKSEIWGRTLDALFGYLPLGEQFQISYLGDPQNPRDGAGYPDVAYNSNLMQSLVVWVGRIRGAVSFSDFEIYARGFLPDSGFVPSFDVDGNGIYESGQVGQTGDDLSIITRYLNGTTELPALVQDGGGNSVIGDGGRTPEEVKAYMDALNNSLGWDVNADGTLDLFDSLPMLTYLGGRRTTIELTGPNDEFVPLGAARTAAEILLHLDCLGNNTPGLTPPPNPVSPGDCPVPPLP